MKKKNISMFWQLLRGYWFSEEKWHARGLLAVVIILNLAMVFLLVMLNNWQNDFYNVVQAYQYDEFWPLVGKFTIMAFIYISVGVYEVYLQQMLQIKWRQWMTKGYVSRWLHQQVYYRLQVLGRDMDNPDQRISEDISQFVTLTLQLMLGMFKQIITLVAFVAVLWNLSGVIEVPVGAASVPVYGYMVWVSLFYAVGGTYLTHQIGKKLIALNFFQQRYEADFRFNMMRVRENAESIAFYGGERPEQAGFRQRFTTVVTNFWQIMRRTKLLNAFTIGYAQTAIIVPLLMAGPRYFSGGIQLGGLMQTIQAFGMVQTAMSYFVDSYATIAQLAAVVVRLGGFTEHMSEVEVLQEGADRLAGTADGLVLENLGVSLPDGRQLLNGCTFQLEPASRLIITGRSGCGKSTFLRTMAGLWPFSGGSISFPADTKILFLPQRPYLPLGSLRQAVFYPCEAAADEEGRLPRILTLVGLAPLAERLEEIDDWSRILSIGEQQRLAFARVLIVQPDWVFLDEATSALDEPREKEMYELLRRELPQLGIVSVGHRRTLYAWHEQELRLDGEGGWQLAALSV